MSLPFLASSRTILLVSDEALFIYSFSVRAVALVESVPWDTPDFSKYVSDVLSKDCKGRPALILYDMVEQHYRKEKVMRRGVSFLDKSTMLKRKLHVAFPNYPVRAALQLKEKAPKTEDKAAPADIYIFAAVPQNEAFKMTMDAVQRSLVPVVNFCLLPIESSGMVKALSQKSAKKSKQKATWSVFIGQHRSGSVRQVVTKNGEIALTRMSPIADQGDNAEAWADEIHQEFKATMSYLSRFGYDEADGLDVTIISEGQAAESLRNKIEENCTLNLMSVVEAAKTLGVAVGYQDEERFADPLHIAWIGRKTRFALPMKADEIDRLSMPRKVATLATIGLIGAGAYFAYGLHAGVTKWTDYSGNMGSLQNRKAQLNSKYQQEVQRKNEMGFDVQLVQSSISIFDSLEAGSVPTLDLFKEIGQALGRELRLHNVKVENIEAEVIDPLQLLYNPSLANGVDQRDYELTLTMKYPGTADVQKGNEEVLAFQARLRQIMPELKVEVTRLLRDYEYTEGLVVNTGDIQQARIQQDFVAEIKITAMLKASEEAGL